MKVFVVISAAVPKERKVSAPPAVKVSAVCARSSRAEEIAKQLSENEKIIGQALCVIQSAIVEVELDES
jgi:hypothetical protein